MRLSATTASQVWAKPLGNTSHAVFMMSTSGAAATVATIPFKNISTELAGKPLCVANLYVAAKARWLAGQRRRPNAASCARPRPAPSAHACTLTRCCFFLDLIRGFLFSVLARPAKGTLLPRHCVGRWMGAVCSPPAKRRSKPRSPRTTAPFIACAPPARMANATLSSTAHCEYHGARVASCIPRVRAASERRRCATLPRCCPSLFFVCRSTDRVNQKKHTHTWRAPASYGREQRATWCTLRAVIFCGTCPGRRHAGHKWPSCGSTSASTHTRTRLARTRRR